jgi:DNA-binding NarL/FixJ family response regulator
MKKPRVLLADDHKIVLEGLRGLLEEHFELAGWVTNGRDLVSEAERLQPDAIVADISMPLLNGIEAAQQVRQKGLAAKIVFLTMHPDATYATRAFEAGASGYVLKHSASDELVTAIQEALRGGRYISRGLESRGLAEIAMPGSTRTKTVIELTARQREVLHLVAEGKSAKEIAAILNISPRTAEAHKYKIMDELGVKTSAELVQYAIRHGLLAV